MRPASRKFTRPNVQHRRIDCITAMMSQARETLKQAGITPGVMSSLDSESDDDQHNTPRVCLLLTQSFCHYCFFFSVVQSAQKEDYSDTSLQFIHVRQIPAENDKISVIFDPWELKLTAAHASFVLSQDYLIVVVISD